MKRKFRIDLEIIIDKDMEQLYLGDEATIEQLTELMEEELPDSGLTYTLNICKVED